MWPFEKYNGIHAYFYEGGELIMNVITRSHVLEKSENFNQVLLMW